MLDDKTMTDRDEAAKQARRPWNFPLTRLEAYGPARIANSEKKCSPALTHDFERARWVRASSVVAYSHANGRVLRSHCRLRERTAKISRFQAAGKERIVRVRDAMDVAGVCLW